jgi:DNA invertase Pin-like site-specific DNA recombinase
MLNEIIATVLLMVLAWFAAGSVELTEERTERRRVQKQIREKYGRTY